MNINTELERLRATEQLQREAGERPRNPRLREISEPFLRDRWDGEQLPALRPTRCARWATPCGLPTSTS